MNIFEGLIKNIFFISPFIFLFEERNIFGQFFWLKIREMEIESSLENYELKYLVKIIFRRFSILLFSKLYVLIINQKSGNLDFHHTFKSNFSYLRKYLGNLCYKRFEQKCGPKLAKGLLVCT